MALFPVSIGEIAYRRGAENRGSLISVPLALRFLQAEKGIIGNYWNPRKNYIYPPLTILWSEGIFQGEGGGGCIF